MKIFNHSAYTATDFPSCKIFWFYFIQYIIHHRMCILSIDSPYTYILFNDQNGRIIGGWFYVFYGYFHVPVEKIFKLFSPWFSKIHKIV